ncbi:hypothetical protein ABZW30_35185 [Kitasatospora sp. NPDC004669]|uniref:hypothetical protein n=1 Tax=Kitasatospora sp. NPDC004669 TaxID=3154555 RepID=UPI0033B6E637
MDELDNDQDKLTHANEDPSKYLGEKGLQVPSEWTVKFIKKSPLTIQVCVNSHCGQVSIGIFK